MTADLSKRANLQGVREIRGLVLASPDPTFSPTQVVGSEWKPLVRAEVESEDSEFWRFVGQASLVGHPYTVRDAYGEFQETMHEGFVTKTLSEDPDVMHNYMHDPITTMSTTRGGGLTLGASPHLDVLSLIPKTDIDGQRFMPKVARGDASSMSFAFRVTDQKWNEDYTERDIYGVSLHRGDVASIVSGLGANPPAWGAVRSAGEARDLLRLLPGRLVERSLPGGMTYSDLCDLLCDEVKEVFGAGSNYIWVRDFTDTWVVYHVETDTESEDYQVDYSVSSGGVVSFSGDPIAVMPKTTYVPEPPEANSALDPDFLTELVAVQLRSRDTALAR